MGHTEFSVGRYHAAEDSPLKASKPGSHFSSWNVSMLLPFPSRTDPSSVFSNAMRDESSGGVGPDSSFDTTVARDELKNSRP